MFQTPSKRNIPVIVVAILAFIAGAVACSDDDGRDDPSVAATASASLPPTVGQDTDDPSPTPTILATEQAATPEPSVAAGTVVTITEFQIQFTVPDSLSDLTWSAADDQGRQVVRFSTTALAAAGPYCGDGAIGALKVGDQQLLLDELVATLPSGNLFFNRAQGACTDDPAASALEGEQIEAFATALETVVYVGP